MNDGRKPERPILAVSFRHRGSDFVAEGMDELRLEEECRAMCDGEDPFVDGAPAVIMLETIRETAEAEGKYIRQSGRMGNYGHIKLRLEPIERGAGFEFIDAIQGDTVPRMYLQAAERGIREAMRGGILQGYEVVDVKVTLFDASHHEIDSNEWAFQIAGSMAFKDAARKASPVLLEPVMAVQVQTSEAFVGAVLADINARRGRIERLDRIVGPDEPDGSHRIEAIVPLSELLRSSRRGRPDYTIRFARYEEAHRPDDLGDYEAGVTANKPFHPTSGGRSARARPEDELEQLDYL
jgi:elongation factor G